MIFLFLLGSLHLSVEAAKVLFSPSTLISTHSYTMGHLANELANRGHQVTWLEYGPAQSKTVLHKSIVRKFLPAQFDNYELTSLYVHKNHSIHEMIWEYDFHWPNEQTTGWIAGTRLCDKMLTRHKETFDKLVAEEFDTVVVDDLYNPCGLLLAGLKHAVYVYWSMTGLRPESAWANQSPHPPSYLPTPGTRLTEDMNFLERSYNLITYLRELYIHQHVVHNRINAVFQKHYPGVPSAFDLERNASLNFVNTPPIYDFARPFMPRVNFVGGLHCHNATQLPSDLSTFVNGADEENGFVVISGGHTVQWEFSPIHIRQAFISAIQAHPKTKFIWQNNGAHIDPLPNLFMAKWLPLQDLLGHKKCKAHITHGGLNSLIESVWHGVPVIGFPLTVRGYDNLLRLTHRGVGVLLTKYNLTAESLTNALTEIKKEKYKTEMLVFQDMVRDVPYTELNHAAFWIEFIERHHEIPHARSGADKLNVLQYFLIDVIAFMISVTVVCLAIIFFTIRTTFRLLLAIFRLIFSGRSKPKPIVTKSKKRN